MTIHQISVFLENRAGQLAEITGILARKGIDLRAINIAETSDYGVLRIIVDRPQQAAAILLVLAAKRMTKQMAQSQTTPPEKTAATPLAGSQ